MQNKKVIRINEKRTGTFSIIPNSILHNKNLKDFDKILFFSILSDSDTDFTFNQTTYIKRFDCERKRISEAIQRLQAAGYAQHKKIGFNHWVYTFSEYGNLSKESNAAPEPIEPTEINEASQDRPQIINKIFDRLEQVEKEIAQNESINYQELNKHIAKGLDAGTLTLSILTDDVINRLIAKYTIKEQAPAPKTISKLTLQDVEKMVDVKTANLTIKETASIKLTMKEWLTNNPNATEQDLSTAILKRKNALRKPIAGYND